MREPELANMVWRPDTCDCILQINNNYRWVDTKKVCRLHQNLKGQFLVDTVLAQNQRFNLALGRDLNDVQGEEIEISKEVNKRRIRTENLDNFHEHLPEHHDLTFFENMKRILGRLNPL